MSIDQGLEIDALTKEQLRQLVYSLDKVYFRSAALINECLEEEVFQGSEILMARWDALARVSDIHTAFCSGLHHGLVKTGSRSK